ncbi:hypothetical protein [Paenibacillus guangzhouensis]|uniref:hypothetical protein n=1 Tax=Paenibacillus guangzhouensis TaxID=1473112 RepID=UPI001266BFDD|nr:hypothetical protein [Paenibacillus guangzhouensis]
MNVKYYRLTDNFKIEIGASITYTYGGVPIDQLLGGFPRMENGKEVAYICIDEKVTQAPKEHVEEVTAEIFSEAAKRDFVSDPTEIDKLKAENESLKTKQNLMQSALDVLILGGTL